MSKHTQGTWRADKNGVNHGIYDEDGNKIATIKGSSIPSLDERPAANARRIVACWNACEGLSTELLEKASLQPYHVEAREKLSEYTKSLEIQRDELLDALQKIDAVCKSIPDGLEGYLEPLSEALSDARAAISKVGGKHD